MRRALAVAVGTIILLAGCAPTYSDPDDRSHERGDAVAEQILALTPQPSDVLVYGRYSGIGMTATLGDMSFADTRDFLEQSLDVIGDSPLGRLPVTITLGHASARDNSTPLKWLGYDPARADRYFAAVRLWMDVLADPETAFDDEFTVRADRAYGTVVVYDDRDLEAYRAELVAALEAAGYVEPGISVVAGE